jgi:6-phosphogluconate dehydrogenase (decarboxylating)
MQVGMIGLGRMGSNMVRRLMRGGHACVVQDVSADAVAGLAKEGATGSSSIEDFLKKLSELWRRGSVISSWLLDLTAQAFAHDPGLANFGGTVADSGEGRWTVAAANDEGIPAFVLTAALFERFTSRNLDLFQNKVLSAMRFGFGGHVEKK